MSEIHFFALKQDLLSVLELVERKGPFKYVRAGNFLKREIKSGVPTFDKGAAIPNLGEYPGDVLNDGGSFLVCKRGTPIRPRSVRSVAGIRICIDQNRNPNAVVFTPGGLRNGDVVLHGSVVAASDSRAAQALMRRFDAAIRKRFSRVKRYYTVRPFYVGRKALELFKSSRPLTFAVRHSDDADLIDDFVTDFFIPLMVDDIDFDAIEASPKKTNLVSFSRPWPKIVVDKPPKVNKRHSRVTLKPGKSKQTGHHRGKPKTGRRSYAESCQLLQRVGYLDKGEIPPMPPRRPRDGDEEPLGVSFFRTIVAEDNLENLTLPRTFIGRSEVGPISFKNSDLSESTLCWNDFNKVDFTDCDLSSSDLRASIFKRVEFVRTNLRNADLRHSDFKNCDFTGADMQGVELARSQGRQLRLSTLQRKAIDWHTGEGEEPEGG